MDWTRIPNKLSKPKSAGVYSLCFCPQLHVSDVTAVKACQSCSRPPTGALSSAPTNFCTCVNGFPSFSNEDCGFPNIYILNIFPMAMFDRGYASVDSQWWLGWASLSGLGGPQEAENDDVEAESQDISFSRYGVGWEFLLGFFLEVSGSWSTNPRIIRDKMKWAPTYVNLWYTVSDEDQLLYPIRRLLHQRPRPVNLKTRRLRDGTAVHKSKFRKAGRLYFKDFELLEQCSNPCWLMMIGDDATQCIGDCGIHQPVQSGILTFASASNI